MGAARARRSTMRPITRACSRLPAPTYTDGSGRLTTWCTATSAAVVLLALPRGRTATTSRSGPAIVALAILRWWRSIGSPSASQNRRNPL